MLYRLYIDESGDHTYSGLAFPSKRYLSLMGVIVESDTYKTDFHPALESLKAKHFRDDLDDPVIFHREDVVHKRNDFWKLRDPENEKRFNDDFLAFLETQNYKLITVVIDKSYHIAKYGSAAYHPYHFCMTVLIERYCSFLQYWNAQGDVLAERRGGVEDRQLKAQYTQLYEYGTWYKSGSFFQKVLTSKELKLAPKESNSAGLQVADLLAHPCKQELLVEYGRIPDKASIFGKSLCRCINPKYDRRRSDGFIQGYGKVFLGEK